MKGWALAVCVILCAPFAAGEILTESYFLYLGRWPMDVMHDYISEPAPQGLAHDDNYWFYTKQDVLVKVPVTSDLGLTNSWMGLPHVHVADLPGTYDHFGDPVCIMYRSREYVLVPLDRNEEDREGIAVYDGDDVTNYLGFAFLNGDWHASHCAWVSAHPVLVVTNGTTNALLYSSTHSDVTNFTVHLLDMEALYNQTNVIITPLRQVPLYYEDGSPYTMATDSGYMQGGEFTPSGDILYVVAISSGLVAFDARDPLSLRRIRRASREAMPFKYAYEPGAYLDEPEGLTVWDLDDGRAPNIRGQLHVILINEEVGADYLSIHHFTHKIHVDAAAGSDAEWGRPETPLASVTQAVVQAWDGQELVVHAGDYPAPVTVTQRLRMVSQDGSAFIGGSP